MIDLHSHILPALDDGARDIDGALAIARAAVADGVRAIAATPHVRRDYPTSPKDMQAALERVREAVAGEQLEIDVLPGGEVALAEAATLDEETLRGFGLGGNRDVLLVETPYTGWPLAFGDVIVRLRGFGITPVLAHPERNREVQNDVSRLERLVTAGALVQVTAASLDGRLGRGVRACAQRLLELELVHLLASDAHAPELREAGLSRARDTVGGALGRWLTDDVPAAIVAGRRLSRRPQPEPKRGLFARRRGR
ncbi:MAG: tyrosine-protein phosphatase [Gaiellaceae bacterium]